MSLPTVAVFVEKETKKLPTYQDFPRKSYIFQENHIKNINENSFGDNHGIRAPRFLDPHTLKK